MHIFYKRVTHYKFQHMEIATLWRMVCSSIVIFETTNCNIEFKNWFHDAWAVISAPVTHGQSYPLLLYMGSLRPCWTWADITAPAGQGQSYTPLLQWAMLVLLLSLVILHQRMMEWLSSSPTFTWYSSHANGGQPQNYSIRSCTDVITVFYF